MDRTQLIDDIRAFNRFYTNRLGVLAGDYLGRPYTLTEARILYEIGARERTTASAINADLGLDPGYLSRVLAKFNRSGLTAVEADPDDRRSRLITLTAKGREEFGEFVDLSRQQVATDIADLGPEESRELASSLAATQQLLNGSGHVTPEPVRLRGPRPGDYGWIIQSQAEAYSRDYGWNDAFETLITGVVAEFLKTFNPERECTWIAELGSRRVGSVMLADGGDGVAKLRLLYLDPAARGRGLGKALVAEAITFARGVGYRQLSLWTNDILVAARHIYVEAGFRLVEESPHTMFGPELNGQTWVLDLQADRSGSS